MPQNSKYLKLKGICTYLFLEIKRIFKNNYKENSINNDS